MEFIKSSIENSKQTFINELIELLAIPSVSAKPEHKNDCLATAEYIRQKFVEAGADNVEVMQTNGNPVVYADKIVDKSLPTVLVYGHYDVQPAEPFELWETPPFEATIRNNRIYARGANDDKGQLYMHVKAFEIMQKNNSVPCNVKFIIEGEEEIGSPNLGPFIADHKEKLKADLIIVSDTSMMSYDHPTICVGLRGLSYVEVEVTGPNRDLHSGAFGGAVANPANILCSMIDSMVDKETKQILIPGFYDDVEIVSTEERSEIAKAFFDLDQYKSQLEIGDVYGESGYSVIERTSIRPTLDINGIWGGYTGEGAKTIIPSKAYAKISMRLVPHQDPDKISELFIKHFESIAPKSVTAKARMLWKGDAYVCPITSIGYKAASQAVETTFGIKPIPLRSGGSIPIIALFEKHLGIKSILMGFGLETDAIHSPNESYSVDMFFKGIETIIHFYDSYRKLSGK